MPTFDLFASSRILAAPFRVALAQLSAGDVEVRISQDSRQAFPFCSRDDGYLDRIIGLMYLVLMADDPTKCIIQRTRQIKMTPRTMGPIGWAR